MSTPIILSHAALEALVCPGRLIDALKQRHSIDGPLRGGQGFHTWAKRYLRHLVAEKRDMDVDAADAIWRSIAPFLSPRTEAFVGDTPVTFAAATDFSWLLSADDVYIEEARFFTHERAEVDADSDSGAGWLLRVTADLAFTGEAHPRPSNVVVIPQGRLQHIVDWKTNWAIDHVDTPEEHRQLSRYAAALWDGESDAVVVWLCFPRRKGGIWEAAVLYPDQLRRAWAELVVAPASVIAAGALVDERVTGPHCLDCTLLRGCDAAVRYPLFAAGVDDLDEPGLVTALGVVDVIKADIEDRLSRIMRARGPALPILVDGHEVKISSTEKPIWDKAAVKKQLEALGLSPEQADEAFTCTRGGIEDALVMAQWKNPQRGGVKAKAKEIAATMPIVHGQSMDFGRRKKSRQKKEPPAGVSSISATVLADDDAFDGDPT